MPPKKLVLSVYSVFFLTVGIVGGILTYFYDFLKDATSATMVIVLASISLVFLVAGVISVRKDRMRTLG